MGGSCHVAHSVRHDEVERVLKELERGGKD
jgi:hypothetical protein